MKEPVEKVAETRPRSRVFDALTVLVFAGALLGPLMDAYLFRPELDRSVQAEYRMPAPRPKAPKTAPALGTYPARFDAWYRDTFGMRDHLLKLHARWMWHGLGLSPTDVVVRGKDSSGSSGEGATRPWIFFDEDRVLETQRGDAPFTSQDLVGWQLMFESRRDWCEARGIEYLSVVVPNKAEIYPEYLPKGHPAGVSRLDQLGEHLKSASDVLFLDLKPALLAAKQADRAPEGDFLYRPLGTHWTDRGAYAGLAAIFEALGGVLPELKVRPLDSFDLRLGKPDAGDYWGSRLYLKGLAPEQDWILHDPSRSLTTIDGPKGSRAAYIERKKPDPEASLKVFVLHDSFGTQLRGLLAERFAKAKFVWDYRFEAEVIESFAPDLVIDLRVERALIFQAPQVVPGPQTEAMKERFKASERVLWRSAGTRELRLWKRGKLEDASSQESPGSFVLDGGGPGTGLLLPQMKLPSGTNLAIRAEFDSPQAGTSYLVYRTQGDSFLNPRRALLSEVKEGRNVLFFEILSSALEGRPLLRLLDKKARHVVHSIEARALPSGQ